MRVGACCLMPRLSFLILLYVGTAFGRQVPSSSCELIRPPTPDGQHFCQRLPYNFTRFPNLVGEQSAQEAFDSLRGFETLLESKCSEQLEFFLCSVHLPMCNEKVPVPIGPCRPLCESVREKCLPIMSDFGFGWPTQLECSNFAAENNNDMMCMPGPDEQGLIVTETEVDEPAELPTIGRRRGEHHANRTATCPPQLRQSEGNAINGALATLSLFSIGVTMLSLLIVVFRRESVRTCADKALLCTSVAFSACCFTYVLSLAYRDQISCMDFGAEKVLVQGLGRPLCSLAAVSLYYFATVARLWWLIVCFTLCVQETNNICAMHQHSAQVKMLACVVPLGLVILVLMSRSVVAHPVSSLCLVAAPNEAIDMLLLETREVVLVLWCMALIIARRPSPSTTVVAAAYPLTAFVYLILYAILRQRMEWAHAWQTIATLRTLFDASLAVLITVCCFFRVLVNLVRSLRCSTVCTQYSAALATSSMPSTAAPHPKELLLSFQGDV